MKKNRSRPARKHKRQTRGWGSLYKRDKQGKAHAADWQGIGTFWLAWTPPGGKRIRQALRDPDGKPITDSKQAEAERKRIMAPYMAGSKVDTLKAIKASLSDAETEQALAAEQALPILRIADAWTAFETHPNRPKCSERTLDQYNAEFRRFASWIAQTHPDAIAIRDVDQAHAVEYAADLDAAQVSASTFNQHRNFLSMLWRVLADAGRMESNPWERIERRKLHSLANRKQALSQVQYDAVLAAAESDPDLRDLFVMLAWTGQRLIDIVTLTWGNVDHARGIFVIHPRKTAARTGKAVYPPIFPEAQAVLDRRQDPGKPYKLDALVFPDLAECYDRDRGAVLSKRIRKVLRKAGLQTNTERPGTARAVAQFGAHSFRHFFVTMAAEAGLPAAAIKAITGHATDAMLEHYQHLGAEYATELAARIGNGKAALPAHREPLPEWARELVGKLTSKNASKMKRELLKGCEI
jgi:integrase